MSEITTICIESPLGPIGISGTDDRITVVSFDETSSGGSPAIPVAVEKCIFQLKEYFSGTRKNFDLPLHPEGTFFQQTVWEQLQTIPYGGFISYLELAKRIGDEKTVRAVGAANGRNPIGIIIPCHRVIGSNRQLVGYAGGLWRKQWLLEHEARFAHGVQKLF